jgi:hypothetical protein
VSVGGIDEIVFVELPPKQGDVRTDSDTAHIAAAKEKFGKRRMCLFVRKTKRIAVHLNLSI